ncbi:MAG TPA: hypothetical protein VD973_11780 [Symbiobacteriaceae bacterium]|jgi:NAD-dependent SIR2 family protein deacetylase|nr:hypothetical protein [Symbiobacteriaceae bacterium]
MQIYLFGAGASAAEGAPATQGFFARAWTLLGPRFDERTAAVWHFLTEIFGHPVTGPDSFEFIPAVDEVISLVDWSLHANQGLGRRFDPPRLYLVRRDLEHLLCATLDAALARREDDQPGPHSRFAADLARHFAPDQVTLISLNYDTLLDDALTGAGWAPDYGLQATASGPLLAKLHGSLNWVQCPACSYIAVTRCPATCAQCGNANLHGLIISPTLIKSYRGAHLDHIWELALARLRQADRIVFVGYSLPQADIAIYHLLQRSMLVAPAGRLRPAVHVINHTASHSSPAARAMKEDAVTSRFRRLFGPRVTFDFSGFHGQV